MGKPGVARRIALVVHRYVGLAMALFLIVEGLTGSLLAFYTQLDAALNPELFAVTPPAPNAVPLAPLVLLERLNAQLPAERRLTDTVLRYEPRRSVKYTVGETETFVDPYSGAILGQRDADPQEWRRALPGFIYSLHAMLALGDFGIFTLGAVALLWTVDCFVGAYLTFPRASQRTAASSGKSWFRRWLPMWMIKTNKLFALVFTWHRASGLWLWGMLLVFAWSGVALNLEDAYEAVMRPIFGVEVAEYPPLPTFDPPRKMLPLPLQDALAIGRRLMNAEAERRGFQVYRELHVSYDPEHACFYYSIESSLDVSTRLAETWVGFDASGRLLAFHGRAGFHAGTTVTTWLLALHFGAVRAGGLAYRSFVCMLGFAVALLSVSGVWIWWRQRRAQTARRQHASRSHDLRRA